jgi:hypothetical protein
MEAALVVLTSIIAIALVLDLLMQRSIRAKGFPTCRGCGKLMIQVPGSPSFPEEVVKYLVAYKLPDQLVHYYVCGRCRRQLWFVPRAGTAPKSVIVAQNY